MAKRKKRAGVARSNRGKSKTVSKKRARAGASKMAKRSSKKSTKTPPKKVAHGSATRKARPRRQKQLSAPNPLVETEILDIVEEPVSGIVTVTEIESVRVTMPDSAEETKSPHSPPEEGMAA
jgi:hypothetical protein